MYCLVLSISFVSRKHTIPPKPPALASWLAKAKEGEYESRTVTYSPAVLAAQRYEAVKSSAMLFFISCFQLNQSEHQGGGRSSADRLKRQQAVVGL